MRSRSRLAFALTTSLISFQPVSAQQPPAPADQLAPQAPAPVAPTLPAPSQAPASPAPAAQQPAPPVPVPASPPAGGPPVPKEGAQGAPGIELPPVIITQPKEAPAKPKVAAKKPKPVTPDLGPAPAKAAKAPAAPVAPAPPTAPAPAASPAAATAPAAAPVALTPPAGTIVVLGGSFAPVLSASGAEITATHGATITDILQTLPGVTGSTFAPGADRPIVRGLDGNRLRVQEGGLGTGDVSDLSEDHGVPVDPCTVEKVDVIHGPAALRYTTKAVGGVVDAQTSTIPTAVPPNGISGEVRGGFNSVDKGRDGCFRTTAGAQGFVVHASGFDRHADDYRIPGGIQPNSFVDSNGYSFGGSYVWREGFAGVAYTRFNSLYAIPGIESAAAKSRIDMGQDKITAKAEWRVRDYGIEAVRAWFGFTNYAHNELDFDAALGADTIGSRFVNKEHEGRFEVDHARLMTPLGALQGTAGIQVSNRDLIGLSFEGDNLLEPNNTRKTAGFLFEELQVSKRLRLLGSVRVERDAVSGSTYADIMTPLPPLVGYDKSFDTVSGSVGLAYELPLGVTARLSALYAERAPEAQELFSKGAHDATGTFEIGNPDLTIEKSRTIEGGFRREKGDLRFDTTAYYTKYNGFIYRALTGEMCDVTIASCSPQGAGGDLKQVIFGQKDATFYGVELTGEYDVAPLWRGVWGIASRYDFVRARFDDGENVPRIPPHRLGGGVYYRDGDWRARVDLLHAFRHDEIGFDETPTSGYTLLNAEASYTLKLASDGRIVPELIIGLKGENLLDDDVRNSASFKKDEVLQPGRNVRLFGIVKF